MPVYKSPSSIVRNIDLLPDQRALPVGSPAIVIGTSVKGPAFVPLTFANFTDFTAVFGSTDSSRFGPIAVKSWLRGKSAGTFIRLLGAGTGDKRVPAGENAGRVDRAGYIVGQDLVQKNGLLKENPYAGENGPPGRTYILGCFMSESAGSTIFSDAGIQTVGKNQAHPIIRGVLMAASGVTISLNTAATANNNPSEVSSKHFGKKSGNGMGGLSYGDIFLGPGHEQNIIFLLNGFTPNGPFSNVITASLLPAGEAPEIVGPDFVPPLRTALNTDPSLLEQRGHLLKVHYDVEPIFAIPTGSQVTSHVDTNLAPPAPGEDAKLFQTAFLLTSSLSRNSGSASTQQFSGVPNLENFENRFTNSRSPFVISQRDKGKVRNLFRIHARSDGEVGNLFKVTIDNLLPSTNPQNAYGTFDLHVRRIEQSDSSFNGAAMVDPGDGPDASSLESFLALNLNPSSDRFISKIVGDRHTFYDFDKKSGGQTLVTEGSHIGLSSLIRVELAESVEDGSHPKSALPVGFRGINHYVTSGSASTGPLLTGSGEPVAGSSGETLSTHHGITNDIVGRVVQPPIQLREHLGSLTSIDDDGNPLYTLNNLLTWGVQFEQKAGPINPNGFNTFLSSSLSYLEYMPNFHTNYQNFWVGDNEGTPDINGTIFDCDRFNNNFFTLERIEVLTSSDTGLPDPNEWSSARYSRSGIPKKTLRNKDNVLFNSRFLKFEDFKDPSTQNYLSFTFPLLGGYDGVNIFDKDKSKFTDAACIREVLDIGQGSRKGPTVKAYDKAIDILEDKTIEGSLLAIPGIRNGTTTNRALELVESRFDMFYVMDIEERDDLNSVITASNPDRPVNLKNTVSAFLSDPRDTTFGAVYFPDVGVEDENFPSPVFMPPSVSVLRMLGNLGEEFQKPLGVVRGKMNAQSTQQIFDDDDEMIDLFFESGINIIQKDGSIPVDGAEPFVRSQITLKNNRKPMSNIAIRRMLLLVRREVRTALREAILFEPNTPASRKDAVAEVSRRLADLQTRGAFKFFKVVAEGPNAENQGNGSGVSSEIDIQNNRLNVKVLIRPNDSSEDLIIEEDGETPLADRFF